MSFRPGWMVRRTDRWEWRQGCSLGSGFALGVAIELRAVYWTGRWAYAPSSGSGDGATTPRSEASDTGTPGKLPRNERPAWPLRGTGAGGHGWVFACRRTRGQVATSSRLTARRGMGPGAGPRLRRRQGRRRHETGSEGRGGQRPIGAGRPSPRALMSGRAPLPCLRALPRGPHPARSSAPTPPLASAHRDRGRIPALAQLQNAMACRPSRPVAFPSSRPATRSRPWAAGGAASCGDPRPRRAFAAPAQRPLHPDGSRPAG